MANAEIKNRGKYRVQRKKSVKKVSGSTLNKDFYVSGTPSSEKEHSDLLSVFLSTSNREGIGVISSGERLLLSIENTPSTFIFDRVAQRELVNEGMPVYIFKGLKEWFALSEKKLAETLDISQRTLNRRKGTDKFNRSESEKVLRVLTLMKMALDLFKDNEIVKDWFKSPNAALGDKTPLEYTDTEPGAREVEDLLGRLAHGVFS